MAVVRVSLGKGSFGHVAKLLGKGMGGELEELGGIRDSVNMAGSMLHKGFDISGADKGRR